MRGGGARELANAIGLPLKICHDDDIRSPFISLAIVA